MKYNLISLLSLVFLFNSSAEPLSAFVHPDTVPASSWSAKWIEAGSAAGAEVDLSGASWLWSAEDGINPVKQAKPGVVYFRKSVTLPAAPLVSARVIMSADNHFALSVNGQEVGKGDSWEKPQVIDITKLLKPGNNVISVRATNDPDAGAMNAAGLIGKLLIVTAGQKTQTCVTDGSWEWSSDEKNWKPVFVIGAVGSAPWGMFNSSAQTKKQNLWTCYRKEFTLAGKPKSAVARIAVDSKYWLWVNGKLVVYEGGLKRGPNPNDTYFDVVDLTSHLSAGSNTLAILAWYWGKDGYSHKSSGKAGLVAELDIDGRRLGTDASWKALRHPAYGTTGNPHPNYRMPDDNIHFDARTDLGDWTIPGYQDASWPVAVVLGQPPCAPWNRLVERPTPLWRVGALMAYENAATLPTVSTGQPIIAHLPRNISISPYLKIKAPAGLTIDMRTDNYKGGSEYNYRSEYVTKDGVQEFESLAYLNGHWMIYTIPAGVEILDLRYRETRYDTDFTGSFSCDDPFLDKLWLKCRHTMNVNMRDAIQDPDRERSQWWGDAAIVQGEILYSCDARGHALIRKAIHNLVDWQKPDGVLYSPVPAGSWDKELPGQMLSSIGKHGFWYYYLHTGDRATIVHAYPAVKRYLALWKIGSNGLLVHRPGGWDWGDWGKNMDRPVIDNALLYQALGSAIAMAQATGNAADVPGYEAMMKSIADNYNRVLWTGREYRSPGYKGVIDDRGHGLAVLAGLAGPEQWPAVKGVFTRSFEASPYMEKYILESLFRMDDADAALARMKSRYSKMVESELSTLWEGWGIGPAGYGGGSYNHGWSGGPLTLLMEYVAGIAPTTPGYVTYDVCPQLGPLKRVQAGFDTVKGRIDVVINRTPEQFAIKLDSPARTSARICLPLKEYKLKTVSVNGTPIWDGDKQIGTIAGVVPAGMQGERRCFTVAPGKWDFQVR